MSIPTKPITILPILFIMGLVWGMTFGNSVHATLAPLGIKSSMIKESQLRQVGCAQRMGPYVSITAARRAASYYRSQGYRTSGVWGEGGVIREWSTRKYYFNVFYC